jgi:hypothetical protein
MVKRKIYELDENVLSLIKKTIDRLVIVAKDGIHIYNDNGRVFIFRNELYDESKNIRVFLDKGEKLETTYEFSKEYSTKVRELLFNKIDEVETSWKEENAKVEAYLKEEKEVSEKKENELFLTELEKKIVEGIEKGETSISLYTTKRSDYKDNLSSPMGFGVNDLKPKYFNAYTTLLINHKERLVAKGIANFVVEFIYVIS